MFLVSDVCSHSEWVATVAFYKAVQIVEAVFAAHLKRHSHGHDGRIEDLKRPVFVELYREFRPLYAASLVARYLVDFSSSKFDSQISRPKAYQNFSSYLPPEQVVNRLLKRRLNVLEQHAVKFLTDDGQEKLKRIQNANL